MSVKSFANTAGLSGQSKPPVMSGNLTAVDNSRAGRRDSACMVTALRPRTQRPRSDGDSDQRQAFGGILNTNQQRGTLDAGSDLGTRLVTRTERRLLDLRQPRANRDKAEKLGWKVVREFVVAESAKRGAECNKHSTRCCLLWMKKNARKEQINVILSHKLDRVCRNMRDAVRLQELEDEYHIQLAFVENQFGQGAAGTLSFNVYGRRGTILQRQLTHRSAQRNGRTCASGMAYGARTLWLYELRRS